MKGIATFKWSVTARQFTKLLANEQRKEHTQSGMLFPLSRKNGQRNR